MSKTKAKQLLDAVQFTKGQDDCRGYIVSLPPEARGESRQWAEDFQEAFDAADPKRRGGKKTSGEITGKGVIVVVTKTRPAEANVRFKDVTDGDGERTQKYVSVKADDLETWPRAPEAPAALIPDEDEDDAAGDDDDSED